MYKKDSGTTLEDARKGSVSSEGKDPDPEIVVYWCWLCDEHLVLRETDSCKECLDWVSDWPEA